MKPRGTLWIVATPIGTIDDLAPRAREVLAEADVILAEDTRRTRALLSYAGIASGRRLRSLHERNEERLVATIITVLREGTSAALVSDAGTPVLSDPGFRLVRQARCEGLEVRSVPGASAFTAALAASGQPPLPATLVGFLPPRRGPRRRRIAELAEIPWTLVVLLSPHRLQDEIGDLAEGLGDDRPATLLVELSKVHERAVMDSLGCLARCDEVANPRGEYVLVIAPRDDGGRTGAVDVEAVRAAYRATVADGEERRAAQRSVARRFGISRRQVYAMLVDDEPDAP